jgi:hypothetical protein
VPILRHCRKAAALLALASSFCGVAAFSGIRDAWKYNGVVIFDRWDACWLYSGIYLMEISEKLKESLRPFQGQAVLIDAQDVWQPMNPGDGLIRQLKVPGPAEQVDTGHASDPPATSL